MRGFISLGLACYLVSASLTPGSAASAPAMASPASDCQSPGTLAVVSAHSVPSLLGKPIPQIRLLHNRNQQLAPIASQIDRRDDDGRYLLDDGSAPDGGTPLLGPDDEIVFRLSDRAARLAAVTAGRMSLVELEVTDPHTGQTGWVYADVSARETRAAAHKPVAYRQAADTVETGNYKIGFSSQHPFLIDRFHWRLADDAWSPNVLDAMKIRHQGYMFGFISFQRTMNDYNSRLTRVKTGPLRVIRRTENRVRVLWQLKTPVLYIDYVMMPNSFVMDTVVDIPFNLGLFFSEVETVTTVDWRHAATLPKLTIHSPDMTSGLDVNGQMSEEEYRFNTISGTRFSVRSAYGSVFINLDIPDDFPIQPWLYLRDQADVEDTPEHQPGQHGNVGYRTTGWENIDTEVHHLKFTTCLSTAEAEHGP